MCVHTMEALCCYTAVPLAFSRVPKSSWGLCQPLPSPFHGSYLPASRPQGRPALGYGRHGNCRLCHGGLLPSSDPTSYVQDPPLTARDSGSPSMTGMCVVCAKSLQSCPAFCDSMDCSPPGSSVHGILQARILEWVAVSFSRGASQPRDGT